MLLYAFFVEIFFSKQIMAAYINQLFFVEATQLKPFGWSMQFSGCLSSMMVIPGIPCFLGESLFFFFSLYITVTLIALPVLFDLQ